MAGPVAVLAVPLLGALGRLLSIEVAKAVAFRLIIYTGLTLILPVVLYNVYSLIISETLTYASSFVDGQGLSSAVVSLLGLGAWLAECLNVPQAISLLLGCSFCRFVIKMIRG